MRRYAEDELPQEGDKIIERQHDAHARWIVRVRRAGVQTRGESTGRRSTIRLTTLRKRYVVLNRDAT